jgi:hypothetical protein
MRPALPHAARPPARRATLANRMFTNELVGLTRSLRGGPIFQRK